MRKLIFAASLLASGGAVAQSTPPLRVVNGSSLLPLRYKLRFTGTGVTCSDDSANNRTSCTMTNSGGTVTSVATGNGLSGGPITTTGTINLRLNSSGGLVSNLGVGTNELGIAAAGVTTAMLATSSLTVNTTTPLAGGGAVSLGSSLTLTCTTCAVTTGSYADPSWITSLAGSKITGTVATATNFSGSLSGDVTGTQSATTVGKLQGRTVAATAPSNNQVLTWVTGNSDWEPANAGSGTVTSVATGSGLTGGPITTTGTVDLLLNASGGLTKTLGLGSNELGIAAAGVSNAMLANSGMTINTTTPLGGGGAVSLGGSLTVTCSTCVVTSGSYSNPSWVTALAGSKITGSVAGNTLPVDYSNGSAGPQTIAFDSTRLGMLWQDAATPITGSLVSYQNNAGTTKFFDLSTTTGVYFKVSQSTPANGGFVIDSTTSFQTANPLFMLKNTGTKFFTVAPSTSNGVQIAAYSPGDGATIAGTLDMSADTAIWTFGRSGGNAPNVYPKTQGGNIGTVGQYWGSVNALQLGSGSATVTFSATPTFNPATAGELMSITLTANITSWTISSGKPSEDVTIVFIQDGTGGRTLSGAASNVKLNGALVLSLGANARDTVTFRWDGVNWIEMARSLGN